ncbi:hypothetical protein Ari01nite_64110 [Paractinoplanes rishiriensis]|uniref:Uncharacterized protein n=2 Tax=Paractinoplanes rishiriensis TaxID=1050105 RepID=A0A919MT65_9ACTN|nr:hypothetical protein Ari01nite_64110 [Actinoplanes rishiriensis]
MGQARLIVITEPVLDKSSEPDERSIYVKVINYSDRPVLDIHVGIALAWGEDTDDADPLEGAQAGRILIQLLGPGEEREFEFAVPDGKGDLHTGEPNVWFLDAHGRRWKRDATLNEPQRVLNRIEPYLLGMDPEFREAVARKAGPDRWWSRQWRRSR